MKNNSHRIWWNTSWDAQELLHYEGERDFTFTTLGMIFAGILGDWLIINKTPSYGNVYKYMLHAFKCIYTISHLAQIPPPPPHWLPWLM
jgi:hypothetical protein